MAGGWIAPSPGEKYGGSIATNDKATRDATALTSVAPAAVQSMGSALAPGEPLFWFGIVAAVSVGLMAYSTTVRVGSATVDLDIGKT